MALDHHVLEVRPHRSRKLYDEDIRSLLKFQNVVTLEAEAFEGTDSEDMRNRCQLLAEILCQLPSLTELHVKHLLDYVDDIHSTFLFHITSLIFRRSSMPRHLLSTISRSTIQKLSGGFTTGDCMSALSLMPLSLKTLIVQEPLIGFVDQFDEIVSRTQNLDALTLSIHWSLMDLPIGKLRNLVALEIFGASKGERLDPLLELSKLTSLTLPCRSDAIVQQPALKHLMKKLDVLELRCSTGLCHLNTDIENATKLKSLTLGRFIIGLKTGFDLDHLPLTSLSLKDCKLDHDVSLIKGFPTLKEFHVEEFLHPIYLPNGIFWSMHNLEKLSLSLWRTPLTVRLMLEIRHLTNLKSLILIGRDNNVEHIFPHEAFEVLTELPHLSCLRVIHMIPGCMIEGFMNMKMVPRLEELSISVKGAYDEDIMHCLTEALRMKAPHLKLSTSLHG